MATQQPKGASLQEKRKASSSSPTRAKEKQLTAASLVFKKKEIRENFHGNEKWSPLFVSFCVCVKKEKKKEKVKWGKEFLRLFFFFFPSTFFFFFFIFLLLGFWKMKKKPEMKHSSNVGHLVTYSFFLCSFSFWIFSPTFCWEREREGGCLNGTNNTLFVL